MANKYSSNDLDTKVEENSRYRPRVDVKPCSTLDYLRSSAAAEHRVKENTPVDVAACMLAEPTHSSEVSERVMRDYNLRLELAAFFLAEQAIPSIDEDLVLRDCDPRVDTMPCSMGEPDISSKVSEQVGIDHSICVDGMNHFLEEHKILSVIVEQLVIDLLLQIIWKAVLFSEEGNICADFKGQRVSPNKTFDHNIQNETFLRQSPKTSLQDMSPTLDKDWFNSKFGNTPVIRNWVSVENIAEEVHNNTKIDKIINDLQNLKLNSWSQSNLDVKCSRKSLPDTKVEVLSLSDEKITKIAVEHPATFPQESDDGNGDQEGRKKCNSVKIGVPKIYERENLTSASCEPPITKESEIRHVSSTINSDNVKYLCDIPPQPCVQLPKKMLEYSTETLLSHDRIYQNLQRTTDGDDAKVKLSVWENSQNQYQKGVAETYDQESEPSINRGNTILINRLLDPHLISLEDQYKINLRIKGLVSSTKGKPKIESNLVKTYKISVQNKQETILAPKDEDQLPEISALSTKKLKMEAIKDKTNLSYKIYNLDFLENNEITPNSMKKSDDSIYYQKSKIYSVDSDTNGKDNVEGMISPLLSVKNDIQTLEIDNMSSYKDFILPSTGNIGINEKYLSNTSTKRDTRLQPHYISDTSFEDVNKGSADNESHQKISNSNEYESELYEMSMNTNYNGENYLERTEEENIYSFCNIETKSEQVKLSQEDTCDISCERVSLENKDIPGMCKLSHLECGESANRVLSNEKSDKLEKNKAEKTQKKSIKRNCKFGMRIRKLFSRAFGRQSRDKSPNP